MKLLRSLKLTSLLVALPLAASICVTVPNALAANPTSLEFTPQVVLPVDNVNHNILKVGSYSATTGMMTSSLIISYVKAFYDYGLMIAGILAALVLMGGGLLWLTSAGNDAKIGQAKELIAGSISGMIILFCSWIILTTINPALTDLKPISTQVIPNINMVCCEYNNPARAESTTDADCKRNGGVAYAPKLDDMKNLIPYAPNGAGNKCTLAGCCIERENGQAKGKIIRCSNSMYDNCPSGYFFMEQNCRQVQGEMGTDASGNAYNASCAGVTDNCSTADNGDDCFDSSGLKGTCYNKLCWLGTGTIGEPCGTELYSKCDANEPQGGLTCNTDKFGRSCLEDVWCCKFKPDGLRLNN